MFFVKSLRAKTVLWSLIPLALVLVAVTFVALYAYDRVTREVVEQRDTELARVSAARLTDGMEGFARILQDAGTNARVGTTDLAQGGLVLDAVEGALRIFDAGMVVYDADANARWSEPDTAAREGVPFPMPADFERVRTTLRPVFSDVFRDSVSDNDVILIGVPVVGGDGAFAGVLAGMLSIRFSLVGATFAEILELKAGQTGFGYLVDGNGRVLYHQDASLVGESLAALPPVVHTMNGESGALVGPDRSGQDVISGFAPVRSTNWGLITQEQWRNVVGPFQSYGWLVLGLLALGGALSGLVAYVAMGQILRPLRELTLGTQRVAAGDFDHQIGSNTSGEVQVLAEQFDVMTAALKDSYRGLEGRVAERTEDLRVSEERYRTLFEQSYDAIFIGREGKIVDLNQAAVDLFGWPRETVIGHDVREFFVEPADRVRMREALTENAGVVRDFHARLRRVDGTEVDCIITARRRTDGDVDGVEGTIRDITEWKRTEDELFEQARGLAVLDERNRMAREIHDTLAQGFTGIVLQLEAGQQVLGDEQPEAAGHLERAKALARESLVEARRSVWDLLPQGLEEESLTEALEGEVDRFDGRGTEAVTFEVTGEPITTSSEVGAALLRICQEALMNVRKYAEASLVEVVLAYRKDSVKLTIRDNGAGFAQEGLPTSGGEASGGFGLTSMRQRARLLGETLDVKSKRGGGTEIIAVIAVRDGGYTTPLTR